MKDVKSFAKERVLRRIKQASQKSPITARTLNPYAFRVSSDTADTAAVRKIIRELIAEGNPIASDAGGYFYIRSAKQCQAYLNRLLRQQAAVSGRIHDIYHAFFKS